MDKMERGRSNGAWKCGALSPSPDGLYLVCSDCAKKTPYTGWPKE